MQNLVPEKEEEVLVSRWDSLRLADLLRYISLANC